MSKQDNFYKKKLENGLVILFEKRKMPVVSVSASVKFGSAFESEKEKGISHFIEHLMFKGTKNRTHKEIAEEIEKKGGILNAFTGEEVTCYWNKLPSKYFSSGIDIARDLILNPKFDKKDFEKEKKVILEEIKIYHDAPQLYVLNKIKSLLYKKPFGLSALGTDKNILSLKRENLISFFNSRYKTDKMFLCVVGNTKLEAIEEYGKKFPKTKLREIEINPIKINSKEIERRRGIEQAHLALGFHISNLREKKRYANEIFNIILTGGMSSHLFEEIREKRALAYDIRGFLEQGKNYGYQIIYVGSKKENVKLCKEIILKEIKKIKTIEKKELEEAKEQLIGLRKLESEESVSVMTALINEETAENASEYYKYEDKILDVKFEEVKELSKLKNYSTFSLMPENNKK